MADNYHDVLTQLQAFGLQVERLELDRLVRCNAEGAKKKAGWYNLREITLRNGARVIVGHYGINRGDDHGTQQVVLNKDDYRLTKEDQDAIKKRQAEAAKRLEELRKKESEDAALLAEHIYHRCQPVLTA